MRRFTTLLITCAALSGCAGVIITPEAVSPPASFKRQYAEFSYQKKAILPASSEEKSLETNLYSSFYMSMPSVGENGQEGNLVTWRYITSKTSGKKKLVIILPIYGSSTFPPEMVAKDLTEWNPEHDTNVLLVFGERDLVDWDFLGRTSTPESFLISLRESVVKIKNTVIDIRRLLDWAETKPEIDQKRIGIVGFSIGAMIAAAVAGVDERIAAEVLAMGGGDPHKIFARGKADFLNKVRSHGLELFGKNRYEFEKMLEPLFSDINPVKFLGRVDASRTLIFEAKYDRFIPEEARSSFWNALGKPRRIILPYSHKIAFLVSMTILSFNYLDREVAEFFREKL